MKNSPRLNLQFLDATKAAQVRNAFMEKFVMTKNEFQTIHKSWLDDLQKRGRVFKYEEALMWDRMPTYQDISFEKAIKFLITYNKDVLFMSENENCPTEHSLMWKGKEYNTFVAKTNSKDLASLIHYEWYKVWELISKDMYSNNYILPYDIYVFNEDMQFMIVFTHENDNWEAEIDEPMKAADARVCIAYGIK